MKQTIYKCRSPFMSRIGQFEEGKHTLVCGILESVILQGKGTFNMTLGTSETKYTVAFDELREAKFTTWKNPQGKTVRIIPVSVFTVHRKPVKPLIEKPVVQEEVKAKTLFD